VTSDINVFLIAAGMMIRAILKFKIHFCLVWFRFVFFSFLLALYSFSTSSDLQGKREIETAPYY
jgi:hypothetical protein